MKKETFNLVVRFLVGLALSLLICAGMIMTGKLGSDKPLLQQASGLKATVDSSVFLGLNTHYFAHTDTGERIEIVQESQIDNVIPDGTVIRLGVKTEKINIFAEDGTRNLLEGVHDDNAV